MLERIVATWTPFLARGAGSRKGTFERLSLHMLERIVATWAPFLARGAGSRKGTKKQTNIKIKRTVF